MQYRKVKYQLTSNLVVKTRITGYSIHAEWGKLDHDGTLTIFAGYAWDGATGWFDFRSIMEGSCAHDIFCEWIAQGLLPDHVQDDADEELRRISDKAGMPKWEQMAVYLAVRWYQVRKRWVTS